MGRLNQGPNGSFSGKAGSLIGSSWKGIFYIKGLQKKSLKPRSPRQIEYQDRFAFAVKFLHPIKNILNMGFSKVNPKRATGYNTEIIINSKDNHRDLHVFLYLVKSDGKAWSNSMYLGHALRG